MLRTIIKSANDPRLYKHFRLANELDCLVVSDEQADKSAAAIDVNVGQIHDPVNREGLAHFLEHMLFLGTEKYPAQNDYNAYITKNSGSDNAYTGLCNTNYYFDCSNSALKGALDRFSQFFISPLFTESCTDKEINAVHSEHEKNLNSDLWRKMQLFRNSSVQGHPFNRFGSGNRHTLTHPTIREDLLGFYKSNYSSNLMKLVIYGNEKLDTLEGWAHEMFTGIKNNNKILTNTKDPAFTNENLGNFWKIYPIKDKDYLEYVWIVDNMDPYYKNNPVRYITNLLAHEGKNSLLSYLISEGLALELRAGYSTEMSLFTKVTINIGLTKKGLENHDRVSRIVFQYLKMLREKGVDKRIFEEIKDILQLRFNFKDKENPMGYVSALASNLQYYPPEDIVRIAYLMENYDQDLIKSTVNKLGVDNMRVYLISKSVEKECNQNEKWYGTPYNIEKFTSSFKEMFHDPKLEITKPGITLDLPPINNFLPKNFNIYATDFQSLPQYPQQIHQSDKMEIWYKQDNTFKQPKATFYFKLYCNDLDFGKKITSHLLLDIWMKLFNESLREVLYLASTAALIVDVRSTSEGPEFFITGFNDSVDKISVDLFEQFKAFDPSSMEEYFANVKERMIRNAKNFYKNQPYEQGLALKSALLKHGGEFCHPDQELAALEKITFSELINFHKNFFKTIRGECLVVGNMTQNRVIEIGTKVEEIISSMRENSTTLPKELIPETRITMIPPGTTWIYEHLLSNDQTNKDNNSAIISIFQYDKETPYMKVIMGILGNYLKDPCFDHLRTNEQLGYIVSGFEAEVRGILNYCILIQSNKHGPHYLSVSITKFIDNMKRTIKSLSNQEFQKYVDSVRVKVAQKDLSLVQESSRYWGEIVAHKYMFDRKNVILDELDKAKKVDLLNLFEELFTKKRKLLETHVVSEQHMDENILVKSDRMRIDNKIHLIHSPEWFKRQNSLYPDYCSM